MPKQKSGPVGRPRADIREHQLFNLAKLGFTTAEIAAHFQCTTTTLNSYIKREHGCTFHIYQLRAMVNTREALQRKALEMALDGNTTMLLSALKKFCAWDKEGSERDETINELEALTDDQLIERARQLTQEVQPEAGDIKTIGSSGSKVHSE